MALNLNQDTYQRSPGHAYSAGVSCSVELQRSIPAGELADTFCLLKKTAQSSGKQVNVNYLLGVIMVLKPSFPFEPHRDFFSPLRIRDRQYVCKYCQMLELISGENDTSSSPIHKWYLSSIQLSVVIGKHFFPHNIISKCSVLHFTCMYSEIPYEMGAKLLLVIFSVQRQECLLLKSSQN